MGKLLEIFSIEYRKKQKIKETTKADQKNGEYMYLEELMRT